jgi:hypothetical protein
MEDVMPNFPESVRAAIIEATGRIAGEVLTKAPGHNEAIRDTAAAVAAAMDALIKNAKEKRGCC